MDRGRLNMSKLSYEMDALEGALKAFEVIGMTAPTGCAAFRAFDLCQEMTANNSNTKAKATNLPRCGFGELPAETPITARKTVITIK
jgi:hypothetical protein